MNYESTLANKEECLEYLMSLGEGTAPEFLLELEEENVQKLSRYIQAGIARNDAGVNKLFESFAIFVKYIPKFLIHSIGPKYAEPAIAARMTSVLPIKQAAALANGFPIEYMGEVTRYTDPQLAAEIMVHVKQKIQDQVTDYVYAHFPLKGLDIASHLDKKSLSKMAKRIDLVKLEKEVLSPARKATLEKMKKC